MPDNQKRPLMEELGIPRAVLDQAAQAAYDLIMSEQYDEAVKMAEGIVAGDHANAYYRTLLATALFRGRKWKQALAVCDEGLKYTPDDADLKKLRGQIATALGVG